MIVIAGVFEQNVIGNIAFKSTTNHHIDVLISIIVDVAKSHAVSFLDLPKTIHRDVFKTLPPYIVEHPVWNKRREIRLSSAQVNVRPAIIIQVTKTIAHSVGNRVEARLAVHVCEGFIAFIVVEI